MTPKFEFYARIELDHAMLHVTTAAGDVKTFTGDGGGNRRTIASAMTFFRPDLILGQEIRRFASAQVAAELSASLSVEIVNTDGWLDRYIGFGDGNPPGAQIWDNRKVTIRSGGEEGSAWEAMDDQFVGRIKRGTFDHTEDRIAFTLYDIRAAHDKPVLQHTFDAVTFPGAESAAAAAYIPIVYGLFDEAGAPAAGGRLPAFCADLSQTDKPFAVAAHPVTALAVYLDGVLQIQTTHWLAAQILKLKSRTGSFGALETVTGQTSGATGTVRPSGSNHLTVTAVSGIFKSGETILGATSGATAMLGAIFGGFLLLNAMAPYDPENNIVTVNVCGRRGNWVSDGSTLDTFKFAVDIVFDLLTAFGDADSADVDIGAGIGGFRNAHDDSDKQQNRRWIGEPVTVMEAVGQIAFENNLYFYTSASGLYSMTFSLPRSSAVASVAEYEPERDSVRAIYDPDGQYANRAIGILDPNLTDGDAGPWRAAVELDSETAQAEYGETIQTAVEFGWIYLASDASVQLERKLLLWSSRSHHVRFSVADRDVRPDGAFWNLRLADVVTLNYWQYRDEPLQIREINRDFENGRVILLALAVQDAFQVSQWGEGDDGMVRPTQVLYPVVWNDAAVTRQPAGRWG